MPLDCKTSSTIHKTPIYGCISNESGCIDYLLEGKLDHLQGSLILTASLTTV